MNIYPNPTNGAFVIDLNEIHEEVKIDIMDMSGKLVYQLHAENTNQLTIELNDHSGIYFVSIICDDNKYMKRLVIK